MTEDVRTALNTYGNAVIMDGAFGEVRREELAAAVFEALRQVLAIHGATSDGKYCLTCDGYYPCLTVAAVSASLAPKED